MPPCPVQCSAQRCIFNNYSLDKHRHQIWDHFLISVLKTEITNWPWILPQFTTSIWKMTLVSFFDGFHLKITISKILVLLRKKSLFIFERKYSKGTLLFQNFKSYIFTFLTLFDFKSFGGVLWTLSFFSWIKTNFAIQKTLAEFFRVKPWPLQQPPEAKLLASVCVLKGQKFIFSSKLSYELQFAGLGWDLTIFYSKETRIVENASLCSVVDAFVGLPLLQVAAGCVTLVNDTARRFLLIGLDWLDFNRINCFAHLL